MKQDFQAQFEKCIDKEAKLLRQLLNALDREHEALTAHIQPALLNSIVDEKLRCMQSIQERHGVRQTVMSFAGASTPAQMIEGNAQLMEKWHAYEADIRQAAMRNEENSALVKILSIHNKQALDMLNRMISPDTLTYGAKGQTRAHLGSAVLSQG